MDGEYKNISEILTAVMKERRVSVDALSNATDIPKRFIDSLVEGDFNNLPAKPYVRGYLFKIAEALVIDQNVLWQSYKNSTEPTTSGAHDRLPYNRFAFKKIRTSRLVVVFFIVIVLAFVGFRYNDILGRPTIDVSLPESTSEKTITVSGNVEVRDTLTLNGEVIYPNEEGFFEKRVQLEPGLNTLEFKVKRYLGQESSLIKQVFYQPESIAPEPIIEE
ncbi:MAG: hypothetical protein UX16_C0013G0008 [Parcubacteria group bacterium GW2011_GWB1_45_7]|uniref:DUF4115 domain-containing protein n=2 Tax=Candidatus Colwelliibacteriota TaxID=1817904 RepID=A0A1G1ZDW6_9BACT|nr:MAG: hypothetical protein UX16_C0013G0008 [Parcubacteria group bacterium GW2011_GWB1_45_7]OGY58799.1 MAG: hypothetical protein A3C03_00795 [Candidatus Colwellbacteria bacterium RIFCSPHIGHO2_02_FULL_45_17]OGY61130.1 MAG: hypothetical protein A3I33_01440 [Candidatus Colwellbacteria bacterium RIFCSPLOWO2_02_FULL_45_11]OGY62070.1 MAG: hypothetical protein A3G58_01595 [Candidatus Colwellbacteria bacterium RIFCSPLOWO2_12_FULL_46_17]